MGSAVAHCVAESCRLEDLPLSTLQGFYHDIDDDVFEVLTLEGSVAARNHVGGTSPVQVTEAATAALKLLVLR